MFLCALNVELRFAEKRFLNMGDRNEVLSRNFSWVVLHISKLHVEMNMARHFIGLNWTFSCPSLQADLVSSQRLPEVC